MTSEEERKSLLQHVAEGFVLVDDRFCLLEMNAEGERIEGRPAAELIGKSLWQSWPALEDSELADLWRKAISTRVPVALEHFYVTPDGREVWLAMRAFPSSSGLAIFYRDVTDRKRTEAALKEAQAGLVHAARLSAMGAMAGTLGHELNQPLTAVSNYLHTAQRLLGRTGDRDTKEVERAVAAALASNERAAEIIRRARAFLSKGEARPQVHDIQTIVADACVLALPQAQRQGVEFRFALDRFTKWVTADDVQIQQVLLNLVNNAIEAMQSTDRKVVTIATSPSGKGLVEVRVEDSGPGLSEADIDRAFASFRSSKPGGLGLGLAISRTIVEAHGGTIQASNSPAGGAALRFTLPRASYDDRQAREPLPADVET